MQLAQVTSQLKKLSVDSEPRWGTMNVQAMVEHLTETLKLAQGKLETSLEVPEEKVPKAQGFILSKHPMPKNFKASFAPENPVLNYSSMNEAIEGFEKEWASYSAFFDGKEDRETLHPNFGMLNKTLWDKLNEKHIQHHLSQFGLND